ncbi:uncharacterized protein BJ171DRAFT_182520 [Polychytrium aggregatum]|uniref:uncharacterized protein n=1 Tax=Polychytrium aggregatum TaxID=110093 RepID=UPI0022FE4029|nr:uncharacterized protein BJ171DRAFT_182520 [Polychytrium aggregatum]KAI9202273.1 hypothetical protein BJ171DRAFT_182520 [Polychytrium aggregatum]
MEIDRDVSSFLNQQAQSASSADVRAGLLAFNDLYEKKLWHQLTLALAKFQDLPGAGQFLIPLCEHFISDWEKHINKLSLIQFAARASKELKDPKASLEFLAAYAEKLKDNDQAKDAFVLATMEAAHYKLITDNLDGCRAAIDQCEKILEQLTATDPTINASFYRVSAHYYKVTAAYPQYYHSALLYLSSVSLDDLSVQEKVERAHDLALSAIFGAGLYNFGELLMHPILDSLKGTTFEWLRNLLFCYNTGDIDGFNRITSSAEFLKQTLLSNSLAFLRQKLCLMTLVEMVFRKSKEERSRLTFQQISTETRVTMDEVEHLVMRALSLGLLKGKIDEIDRVVEVSWVQPRVLDMNQIKTIKARIEEWAAKVSDRVVSLENEDGVVEVFAN